MNAILSFKNVDGEDTENLLCRDDLRDRLNMVHEKIMSQVSLLALQEPSIEVSSLNLTQICKYNRVSPVSILVSPSQCSIN